MKRVTPPGTWLGVQPGGIGSANDLPGDPEDKNPDAGGGYIVDGGEDLGGAVANSMTRHRHLAAVLVGVLILVVASEALAGSPTEQLKHSVNRLINVLQDSELKTDAEIEERRAAIREIANETFDFAEAAKRALARHWHGRTTREREEFVKLFVDLLERAYLSRSSQYGGERVIYLDEIVDGDRATLRTKVITKQRAEVPVNYRMLRRRGRWLVYDVVVEGLSVIRNYRVQLDKIIRTSSYEELVKKLKAKHAKARKQEGASAQGG